MTTLHLGRLGRAPLGLALAVLLAWHGRAYAGDPLKPYVLLILDTSGSMENGTGSGPPSCGGLDTRLNHAKCAINQIANSYGDMVLALSRFRQGNGGSFVSDCASDCYDQGVVSCSSCGAVDDASRDDTVCTPAMRADSQLQILSSLVDGNNAVAASFTDGVCTTCAASGSGAEIYDAPNWTPLAGSLAGARRYWQGLQASNGTTLWPANEPGFAPIANDPTKDVFLATNTQCRPYITILLTDGAETCAKFSSTTDNAEALLATPVGGKIYRIETKPIGFGRPQGDSQIEALAHAGGVPDVGGQNEGFYAQNEEELQLAISSIIADAVRSETCNDQDDDCDAQIDEDFPSKGQACHDGQPGVCRGTGHYVCRADGTGTECVIDQPGQAASTEICDGLDNDCDGLIDEGACGGCLDSELCNNRDDDCDMRIDEDLMRPCGSDVGECSPGTSTCAAGTWSVCTGQEPTAELCDGLDNDCDGTRDGVARSCSTLPGGNPGMGICRPGTQTCPSGGNGQYGTCLGEVVPRAEACNTLDDDCDGEVDEDAAGQRCSTTCGVGYTECVSGQLICNARQATTDDTCDGFDDDCDMRVDEDAPDMGECDAGGTLCGGLLACQNGQYRCTGGEPVREEACDCSDNDCDDKVDETPNCPGGSACVNCQCAYACDQGEFPCSAGKKCEAGYCVDDNCYNVTCDPTAQGHAQTCKDGACVEACTLQSCLATEKCDPVAGYCKPDNCIGFPELCTATQLCVAGACVDDPCLGVSCGANQYCAQGQCVASCAGVKCESGAYCKLGACVATACANGCLAPKVCDEQAGTCVEGRCEFSNCEGNTICDPLTGACVTNPCLGVSCPTGQRCLAGSCYDPTNLPPDGTAHELVTTGGGGRCGTGATPGWWFMLFVPLLTRRRLRRRSV